MPSVSIASPSAGYASFQLRFRALLLDAGICLTFFIVGGVAAGAALEHYPFARSAIFVLIVTSILLYDPLMVSQYGGTLGHRAFNICVVQVGTRQNLSLPKAIVRAVIKAFLGVFSLTFMFITKRAQGLHDLAAGSEVRIRNPRAADARDYFVPDESNAGQPFPSPVRRLVIIALYLAFLFVLTSVAVVLTLSPECIDQNICTAAEDRAGSILGFVMIGGAGILIVLGWRAQLPGGRRGKPRLNDPMHG